MMTDQQYLKYIKSMILNSLERQYDQLDSSNKNTINTLLANSALLDYVAVYLRDWSYQQAKNDISKKISIFFLTSTIIEKYIIQYVNSLTQESKQIQKIKHTR